MAKDKKEKKSKKEKKEEEPEVEAEDKVEKKKAKKAKKEAAEEPEAPKSEKKAKKEKKEKKRKAEDSEEAAEPEEKKAKKAKKSKKDEEAAEEPEEEEEAAEEPELKIKKGGSSGDAANPTGTCEVFMGNLSFQIDDDGIKAAFKDCGEITNCKWLEHRDTGRFKGAGFITFATPEGAAKAVAMNGSDVMGRPVKVDFSNGKPAGAGGAKGGKKGEVRPMQAKPDGCNTLFCGNLSWDVNDDVIRDFFKDCGEISQIRWLTDKDTGDFKGCGFIEFADPDSSLDKAAQLNGADLMGRTVRLDYASPRAR